MNCQTITSFVNKAYRRLPIELRSFQQFVKALGSLYDMVNDEQTEEEQKSHFKDFLTESFYGDFYVAPQGNMDITIHNGKNQKSSIGVLIEVKRTINRSEMITCDNLNRKALHELLLYYLRERVSRSNTDLKYLIITNIKELFIFDAQEFERKFFNNKRLISEFKDYERKSKSYTSTDGFYNDIASRYIKEISGSIQFYHVDLYNYKKFLNKEPLKSRKLIELYKVLSPECLLKLPLQNDSNSLNRSFYNELLHILGIKEKKKGNKIIIVRKDEEERNEASLIENTISRLDSMNCLYNLGFGESGEDYEDKLFDVAMELCITWINRILFLKLLEAQLVKYHDGDSRYRFLKRESIKCFNDLDTLFFRVVACNYDKRSSAILNEYPYIPYLNSSLFEVTELENKTLRIGNLSIREYLPLYSNTVLKDKENESVYTRMSALDYLLLFLDSYDFASEDDEEVKSNAKTLINASVLGLIFEKINGHKDGAVFTPGYITMYMCRESLTKVIVNKFNEFYDWRLGSYDELLNKDLDIRQANDIINNIKICDPSVGSGHYLVSALNELLRIKFELGILSDKNGKRIKAQDYNIIVENDELIVLNSDGSFFNYRPLIEESRRIQETLFNEKRLIIENCLFGVDINPSSVNICRLRLWIELLKNTYYTEQSGFTHLETLPNIDINIKHGNSLVHRFPLNSDLTVIMRQSRVNIQDYKSIVSRYKAISDKKSKHNLELMIRDIKTKLRKEIYAQDKDLKRLKRLQAQLLVDENPLDLGFSDDALPSRVIKKRITAAKKEISKIEKLIENRKIGGDKSEVFEWRIEFPELLNEEGEFIGFDLVIGNPPYIQLQTMHENADLLEKMGYKTYMRTGDIYCLFYEFGVDLLRNNGLLSFITSNKWMKADYGNALRQWITANANPYALIDFEGCRIFDEVSVSTNILFLQKKKNEGMTQCCKVNRKEDAKNLDSYVPSHVIKDSFSGSTAWSILSPLEISIRNKIEQNGIALKNFNVQINLGIKTGCNEAFIIDSKQKDEIISMCRDIDEINRTKKIIRPILRGCDIRRYATEWADKWIINTHNGIKGVCYPVDVEMYPAIKDFLNRYNEKLQKRFDSGDTIYNLRNCAYLEDFDKKKIIWLTISDSPKFALDDTRVMSLNSTYIMTGDDLERILICLNSKLIQWYFPLISSSTGEGTVKWEKFAVEQIPIPKINADSNVLLDMIYNKDYVSLEKIVSEAYGLTKEEIEFIREF